MKTSPEGLVTIARKEGLVVAPYRDSVNVLTWGVGHTAAAGDPDPAKLPMGMPLTRQAMSDAIADALHQFSVDLGKYEARVNDAVKVPLEQHEFDALVSFDFNTGGIYKAKLTQSLNRGDKRRAGEQFMGWLKPPEIRGRRTAEQQLFMTGDYGSGNIPIWGTNGKGKLAGVVKTVSPDDLLRMMEPIQMPVIASNVSKGRNGKVWSTTLQSASAQILTATGGIWAAITQLEGTTQIAAIGGCALILATAMWIFRERLQKWAAGIR